MLIRKNFTKESVIVFISETENIPFLIWHFDEKSGFYSPTGYRGRNVGYYSFTMEDSSIEKINDSNSFNHLITILDNLVVNQILCNKNNVKTPPDLYNKWEGIWMYLDIKTNARLETGYMGFKTGFVFTLPGYGSLYKNREGKYSYEIKGKERLLYDDDDGLEIKTLKSAALEILI